MRAYTSNKAQKDSRFLTFFRKAFNKDRKLNGFSPEEAANELGISSGTLEQKLKPSAENDITVSEWSHHLDLTADFTTLEYFVQKHGFSLRNMNLDLDSDLDINVQADKAMIECNEAWKTVKESIEDKILTKEEKIKSDNDIDIAIKALQQLRYSMNNS